jgi:hypothetical protein
MSFTSFNIAPMMSREQIAAAVHKVSIARGLDTLATVLCCMGIATEVGAVNGQGVYGWWCPANPTAWPDSLNYPHDSESDDGRSSGYLQQQPGPNGEPWWGTTADMMTLSSAANNFLDRLTDNWQAAANNPTVAGHFVQQVQGSAFPDRYAQRWQEAWDVVNRALATPPCPPPAHLGGSVNRPDFNEYARWSPNSQSRNGVKPTLWLLHTEECAGYDNADGLANFLDNPANEVSYHYTISKGQNDDGVTVVDVVNTDLASWSVGDANNRSINLCFAGSHAAWTRDEWLANVGRAIDVAAYLAVQDCRKYGIPIVVVPPPYNGTPGISDHHYVTTHLWYGTGHTDVGDNFPWDAFSASVAKYAAS